jgi:hypothetical protein
MEVSGQLHAPAALPPGKEPPGTHWIGGWVGPVISGYGGEIMNGLVNISLQPENVKYGRVKHVIHVTLHIKIRGKHNYAL